MNKEASIVSSKREEDHLSPEDMVKVFELLKGSTSVELKLIVADSHTGAVRQLGFDPIEAEPRQTWFFDTPDLALSKAGLFVRTRRGANDRGDTAVKIRPVDPDSVDAELRRDAAFKIEVDVMPGGFVCSASARGRCTGQEVLDVASRSISLESILTANQRSFFAAHAPEGLSLDELVPLGPIFLLRLKRQPKKFDRPIVVELWLYPDGSRILEISTKGDPREAFQLAVEFRAFLGECGIPVARRVETKTGGALAYFRKQRQAEAA